MHVLATAGHVDHGKSTLVRALTGMEPDRWAEERRRGLTLDLGFAWTNLPGGESVAFVDVPGHQRFLANMLAGVGPVPAVLFVVAADEGWCRQSQEHLSALDALDVRHALIAVTRCDLADPGPATAQALERLAGTSLGGSGQGAAATVAVSGRTGAGLDTLRTELARLVAALPPPRRTGPVRLWVDRSFRVAGAGTVVTGTLGGGALHVGDGLELSGSDAGKRRRRVRVRNLQMLGADASEAQAVARVALNVRSASGDTLGEINRGDALLTPGSGVQTAEVDVRLSADPAGLPSVLVLHVGSAGVPARLRPLGAAGGSWLARLLLDRPLPLERGDRGVLRDPGGQRVVAGVRVLDLEPPSLLRRGAAQARAGALGGGLDPVAEVERRGAVTRERLAVLGVLAGPEDAGAPLPVGLRQVGGLIVSDRSWQRWAEQLAEALTAHDAEHPLEPGLPLAAAAAVLQLPDAELVTPLAAAAGLRSSAGRVIRAGAAPSFSPAARAALDGLRERLATSPFAAPEAGDLIAAGLDRATLGAADRAGLVLRLAGEVVLLPTAEDEAVRRLAALPQPFTTSQARQALETTRRVAIPLLEHLDGRRRTRRLDASRRQVLR